MNQYTNKQSFVGNAAIAGVSGHTITTLITSKSIKDTLMRKEG